jgi:DNA-binding LytR/AlgR family response regulator
MSGERILIVKDERIGPYEIESRLKHIGYEIAEICNNGLDALKFFGKSSADLVLMGVKLQGELSGIETAQKIMHVHHKPVLYCTGCNDETMIDKASHTGAYGYMIHPVDDQQLKINIEMALGRHHLESLRHYTNLQLPYNQVVRHKKIAFWEGDEMNLVNPNEIIFVDVESGQVSFYLKCKVHSLRGNLKCWQEKLEKYGFFRCHKNYMINLEKVEKILQNIDMTYSVKMKDRPELIQVARKKATLLKEQLEI